MPNPGIVRQFYCTVNVDAILDEQQGYTVPCKPTPLSSKGPNYCKIFKGDSFCDQSSSIWHIF